MKKAPHLSASIIAFLGALLAAGLFVVYASQFEKKYIHSIAQLDFHAVLKGQVLQRLAFKQKDLLVLYGSSEVVLVPSDYEAYKFFRNYPTGFMVFTVANKGTSMLSMAQDLAALGPDMRGKKFVISFAPATATMGPGGAMNADNYDPNFSELHALELAFSPYIKWETKGRAAKRMLDYPNTLAERPFLKFTLQALADGSTLGRIKYILAWPLGRLQIAIINVQDHYAVWDFTRHQSTEKLKVTRKEETIDWQADLATAEQQQIKRSDTNTFGVDNDRWLRGQELMQNLPAPGSKDARFVENVQKALDWNDMDILLTIVKELDGRPLLLGRPMNVGLWEALGYSEDAQNTYYQMLHQTADSYGYPIVDFRQYGRDKYFSVDMASHSSPKGWMYINEVLDNFYHDRNP
ncbi:MAG: D-alanyl-lipoteichoic acid biosynthesis protein DltD [Anaerolineales bacterium]